MSDQPGTETTDPASDEHQTTTPTEAPSDTDWKAEAEKWKTFARKHEQQAKTNADKAKQFDELNESQKSDAQKAIERAEAAERKAAEVEARAMRAEVAASKGVPVELLAGKTREELEAAADKLLEFRGNRPTPDFGAGDRGGDVGGSQQWTKADLDGKSAAEIEAARKAGHLDRLMGKST